MENEFKQNYKYVNNTYKQHLNSNIKSLVKRFNTNKEKCLNNFDFENFKQNIIYDFYKINNLVYNHNNYNFSEFEKLFKIVDMENFIIKIKGYKKIDYNIVMDIILNEMYLIISNNEKFYRITFNYNRNFYKKNDIYYYLFQNLID